MRRHTTGADKRMQQTNASTKITASGGTDGANMVLFWPDNLPDDADAILESDPIALVENLRDQGKLIWFLCDGDGGYTVAIFVRSVVPDDLIAHCGDEERIPSLVVRGVGYFGGMEYMFKHDSSFLKKHPNMGEQVKIPEGTYSARVYRTAISETFYESWLLTQAGVGAKRFWDIHGTIAACAIASIFASLIAFFFVAWTVWFCILAIASILVFGAVAMSRTEKYKRVARARDAFEKAYPSYVVHLE
jgi:hypothetical protein